MVLVGVACDVALVPFSRSIVLVVIWAWHVALAVFWDIMIMVFGACDVRDGFSC